jgi:murein DD-endopeptidase MepM/ murein hydrolase activator NlpD
MTSLAWPLERNHIRRDSKNNAYGMVRNGGTRAHQGWDLEAAPCTPCYAIADGVIAERHHSRDYGYYVLLEFSHDARPLYAMYAHLTMPSVFEDDQVRKGDQIGLTGNSGNASSMRGADQHLHFEIRTARWVSKGLDCRIDPATLYGTAPIGWTFYELHGQKRSLTGDGLKVRGVNVRERVE